MSKATRHAKHDARKKGSVARVEKRQDKKTNRIERHAVRADKRADVKDLRVDARGANQNKKIVRRNAKAEHEGARLVEKTERGRLRTDQKRQALAGMQQQIENAPAAAVEQTIENSLARENRTEAIRGYLQDRGYGPDEIAQDPALLVAQAYEEYTDNVFKMMEDEGLPTYEDAEEMYNSQDYFDRPDCMDPVTTAFVEAAGEKVISEIAKKRAQAGKKFLGGQYDPKTGKKIARTPATPSGVDDGDMSAKAILKRAANAGYNNVKKKETESTIMDYAPFIAAGLAIFALVIYAASGGK